MRSVRLAPLVLLALSLGGCTSDQKQSAVDLCELDAMRTFPGQRASALNDPPGQFVVKCMRTRGYMLRAWEFRCMWSAVLDTSCYQPDAWWKQKLEQFEQGVRSFVSEPVKAR
jgi:hypothetical protein